MTSASLKPAPGSLENYQAFAQTNPKGKARIGVGAMLGGKVIAERSLGSGKIIQWLRTKGRDETVTRFISELKAKYPTIKNYSFSREQQLATTHGLTGELITEMISMAEQQSSPSSNNSRVPVDSLENYRNLIKPTSNSETGKMNRVKLVKGELILEGKFFDRIIQQVVGNKRRTTNDFSKKVRRDYFDHLQSLQQQSGRPISNDDLEDLGTLSTLLETRAQKEGGLSIDIIKNTLERLDQLKQKTSPQPDATNTKTIDTSSSSASKSAYQQLRSYSKPIWKPLLSILRKGLSSQKVSQENPTLPSKIPTTSTLGIKAANSNANQNISLGETLQSLDQTILPIAAPLNPAQLKKLEDGQLIFITTPPNQTETRFLPIATTYQTFDLPPEQVAADWINNTYEANQISKDCTDVQVVPNGPQKIEATLSINLPMGFGIDQMQLAMEAKKIASGGYQIITSLNQSKQLATNAGICTVLPLPGGKSLFINQSNRTLKSNPPFFKSVVHNLAVQKAQESTVNSIAHIKNQSPESLKSHLERFHQIMEGTAK
ncbi:MAG: hypothetical protein A3F67_02675 [Verrucomicrobia bacterium RIFCSPHIGHO2_12_FULL_41_10]|nr:MAG: hypothetical protein A3F67_02675 [Verrucomicrobia bacterium RIFCSPHIGHO2_12_FULL_41_10]HLB34898.1 hypothetical protein [Chthoniobacterales bacterium]